jgi:hypothetical protein
MADPMGTDSMNLRNPTSPCRTQPGERCGDHFAAPLGYSRSGRLRFTNGAHRVIIRANSHMPNLCCARFGERMPAIQVQGGTVTIRYPRAQACDWLDCWSERPAEVELNARVTWDLEVRGGASRLVADLGALRLGSLGLDGGASRLEVVLPWPVGTVGVVIFGGASNIAISRPEGVAARLRVDGGATNLRFDERHIGAAGGELDLQDRYYDGADDRFDVAVTGGVNNVSIDKQRGTRGRGSEISA